MLKTLPRVVGAMRLPGLAVGLILLASLLPAASAVHDSARVEDDRGFRVCETLVGGCTGGRSESFDAQGCRMSYLIVIVEGVQLAYAERTCSESSVVLGVGGAGVYAAGSSCWVFAPAAGAVACPPQVGPFVAPIVRGVDWGTLLP